MTNMGNRKIRANENANDAGLRNHEIVTLAVYLLGGETRSIDTEHVAMKAAELAPGRYNWRLYPVQINIELVRTFLSDAKKTRCGSYLNGSTNEGWMLTEAGADYARKNVERLHLEDLTGTRRSNAEKKWYNRERTRLLASDAFVKVQSGEINAITSRDAEAFFRLDEYVTGESRHRKILRIVNAFGNDPELAKTIVKLRDLVKETLEQ